MIAWNAEVDSNDRINSVKIKQNKTLKVLQMRQNCKELVQITEH